METSKVQVEYSDPSGVFASVRPSLQSCLPLRNLHWYSSTRPLRSISSLHVDLIPDTKSAPLRAPATEVSEADDVEHASTSQDGVSKKERRHQIPGLRQTPYLKIYLLQCENIDTYRASSRQSLRDWVNIQAPISQSSTSRNKQEKHDAFEWLIVHVESNGPDSIKSSGNTKGDSESTRKASSSRWTSRSTKSVIEKLRSDFNGTSKHATDRVAQIQISSTSEGVDQSKRNSQDEKAGRADLIGKMKSLILASFDLRVQQYEDDIKEKELQQSLPGWNFNTFFVLKEGLARGFESVGLIEDALAGYHELAAGLNGIIEEQVLGEIQEGQTTRFQSCTDDLQRAVDQALKSVRNRKDNSDYATTKFSDLGSSLLDTDRKPFRNLILENNISVFDFQCYVFARRIALMLRLANAQRSDAISATSPISHHNTSIDPRSSSKPSEASQENHLLLVDVCQLALSFIASSAWTIRRDVNASFDLLTSGSIDQETSPVEPSRDDILDNLIASWTFSACHCVLEATKTQALIIQLEVPLRQLRRSTRIKVTGLEGDSNENGQSPQLVRLPRRTSSLSFRSPSATPMSTSRSLTPGVPVDHVPQHSVSQMQPGLPDLAGQRGEVVSLARRTLSRLGFRLKSWQLGFDGTAQWQGNDGLDMRDVDLESSSDNSSRESQSLASYILEPTTACIGNKTLEIALESKEKFYAIYEDLTALALVHYIVAEMNKKAEAMTADMAVLCFHLQDHDLAASYFKQLTSYYNDKEWLSLGTTMLDMWAECLKELGNAREYISVALTAIASVSTQWLASPNSMRSLVDLIRASDKVDGQITVPLANYFTDMSVCPYVGYFEGSDGFELELRLQNAVKESFKATSMRVQIISISDDSPDSIWLSCETGLVIRQGLNKVKVASKTMIPGWYKLNKILMQAGGLTFDYDVSPTKDALVLPDARTKPDVDDPISKRILVWRTFRALAVDVTHSHDIRLSEFRSIDVNISSGWNDIVAGTVTFRAASAGLRLHTAQAEARGTQVKSTGVSQPGTVLIDRIAPGDNFSILIPYSLEMDLTAISLRVEIAYSTVKGQFMYATKSTIPVILPLAVNVQDTFKENVLYSLFTIRPSTSSPIRIIDTYIEKSNSFEATTAPSCKTETGVFSGQPFSVIAQVRRKAGSRASEDSKQVDRRLHLTIEYHCLDRMVCAIIEAEMLQALAATHMERFSRLLLQHLRSHLRSTLTPNDFENFALLDEFALGAFEQYNWDEILHALPINDAAVLRDILREWHLTMHGVAINDKLRHCPLQRLVVPVDMAEMKVVHKAQLDLLNDPAQTTISTYHGQGRAMQAELAIEHTRHWGFDSMDDKPLDFYFEMQANPDAWLVGGQRSARFSAREGERIVFPILLLPQRPGHLLLPSIDIQPISYHRQDVDSSGAESSSEGLISCETDYLNQAETVLIIPDISTTTVSLDPNGTSTGAWLVDAQNRHT